MTYELINDDCLNYMAKIKAGSINAIITDLPYEITKLKWDIIIPFEPMWKEVTRVLKPAGAFITTASQPFTSALVMSNVKMFSDEWIWSKSNPSNIAASKNHPLKYHENIVVFGRNMTFNKQMIPRDILGTKRLENKNNPIRFSGSEHQNRKGIKKDYDINRYDVNLKNPSTILNIKVQRGRLHPTQKPIALYEHLIRTYTNPGETVLDIAMGSGTTIEAAERTGRNSIGIEKDKDIFETAVKRLGGKKGEYSFTDL